MNEGNAIVYDYGSPPVGNYKYVSFLRQLAPHLTKDDAVFFWNGTLQWRADQNHLPLVLFRNVCHWKSPRKFGIVQHNTQEEIDAQWRAALRQVCGNGFNDDSVRGALRSLIELNGVGIGRATALLTAWNPEQFGIVDFKVLAVLGIPNDRSSGSYITFRSRLLELKQRYGELRDCALRQIELALWHYYPIQETDKRERPD